MRSFLYAFIILAMGASLAIAGQGVAPDTIQARAGEEFVIVLDANATTGYEWQIASPIDEKVIRLIGSKYVPDNTGLVGSGGKSSWTFKALQAGRAKIDFKYVRSWEKGIPPAKEASYMVNIENSAENMSIPKPQDKGISYSEAYDSVNTGANRAEVDEDS